MRCACPNAKGPTIPPKFGTTKNTPRREHRHQHANMQKPQTKIITTKLRRYPAECCRYLPISLAYYPSFGERRVPQQKSRHVTQRGNANLRCRHCKKSGCNFAQKTGAQIPTTNTSQTHGPTGLRCAQLMGALLGTQKQGRPSSKMGLT